MSGKPWKLSINYGPEGEQNYAYVFDGNKSLVGNLRTHHANAVVTAVNSYASSQAEIERLRKALTGARDAIASLEPYALGGVSVDDPQTGAPAGQYPIRDELLSEIDRALSGSKE